MLNNSETKDGLLFLSYVLLYLIETPLKTVPDFLLLVK